MRPARPLSVRFVAVLALVGSLTAAPAAAQEAASAKAFIQELSQSVITDLASAKISDSERVKRLRRLLSQHFDVQAVGRFVLGPYRRRASDAEFQEFLDLYQIYVAHNYAGLFEKYSGQTVDVVREQSTGEDNSVVFARIRQASGPPVSMEIRVRKAGDTFKILDIKIEGVSMPLTHRKQFGSVINRSGNGIEGLLDALRKATKRFEAENPSQ